MDAMMQACQKAIGCMLFEGVEQAQAMQLLQTFAQLQTFEKGQIIYSPGALPALAGHHRAGTCGGGKGVRRAAQRPWRRAVLWRSGAVCAAGPVCHHRGGPKPAVPSCFCRWSQMRQILLQNPVIAFNYIRFLSGRIQFLNRKIDSFTAPGAQQALLSYLRQQPGGKSVGLSMVKLSEMLNIGRTSLYRAVEQLEQCGKIKPGRAKTIQLMPESPSPEERLTHHDN